MSSAARAPETGAAGEPDPAVNRGAVLGGLIMVLLLAALDGTIVATALPTIVAELGGLEHLAWVVTAYLLAQTAVIPLYGKLARQYSLEPTLLPGALTDLRDRGLAGESRTLTSAGHAALDRLVAARRVALGELLAEWSPDTHGSLSDYLRHVARDFAARAPA